MSIRDLKGSRPALAYGVGMLAAYGVWVIAAATGSVLFFTAAAVLAVAAEAGTRLARGTRTLLTRLRVMRTHRHLAGDAAVLLFLVGQSGIAPTTTVVVGLLLAGVWALSIATGAVAVAVTRALELPVLVRNIDLAGLPLPVMPPRVVMRVAGRRMLNLTSLLVPGAIATAVAGSGTPVVACGVAAVATGAGFAAAMLPGVWRAWRAPHASAVLPAVRERVQPAPTVLLHFAGGGGDAYQVNMWLRTVEALAEPALVLLRERSCFPALAETTLPVVCITNPVDVINFGFDSIRVALHPSNVGKNIHILREPGMKHVFVGHGDSDKVASINPYTKVYDEVWVAGRAGRDRYAAARVGVRDEAIVEVGRPQLAGIATARQGGVFTVLYAPTWEGWVEDPHATSLLLLGEQIVSTLLSVSPAVRVWYKPHPLTGKRSQAAAAVHKRMVTRITAAGGGTEPADPGTLPEAGHHAFPTTGGPDLHACFNSADLLISDVSSVVSDWLASRKPYVVANTRNLPEDEFRELYPTASAAYLLPPDGSALEKIVQVTRSGEDPLAESRRELQEYLLGPDDPPALERFRAEVARLCHHRIAVPTARTPA
jgi:hypothetical protein